MNRQSGQILAAVAALTWAAAIQCSSGDRTREPTDGGVTGGAGGNATGGSGGNAGAAGKDGGGSEASIGGADGSGGIPGDVTCGHFSNCVNMRNCADAACGQKCADENGLTQAGLDLYNAFIACIQETCCNATAGCGGAPMMCDQTKNGTQPCCQCIYDSQCKGTLMDMGPPDPAQATCAQTWADCYGVPVSEIKACTVKSKCTAPGP